MDGKKKQGILLLESHGFWPWSINENYSFSLHPILGRGRCRWCCHCSQEFSEQCGYNKSGDRDQPITYCFGLKIVGGASHQKQRFGGTWGEKRKDRKTGWRSGKTGKNGKSWGTILDTATKWILEIPAINNFHGKLWGYDQLISTERWRYGTSLGGWPGAIVGLGYDSSPKIGFLGVSINGDTPKWMVLICFL